jgi:uncharacterized protein DUF6847
MKLAEALSERKSLFDKVGDITGRLRTNALVQEGETPTEQPAALRAELDAAVERLAVLIKAINRTNVATRLEDGQSIAEAITDRDMLQLRVSALGTLVGAAAYRPGARVTRTELRTVATVDVPALRRELDDLSRQSRQLDVRIQAANWATDLIETQA